jgi:hypothetical protein
MKKIDLGQTIGILANVGVILGLVLVVVEIRQSNEHAAAAAYQARIGDIEVAFQQYALSAYLPAIYVKLRESGLESLTAEERDRVRSWESARRTRMQGQFYQHEQGLLDEPAYRVMLRAAHGQLSLWQALELERTLPGDEFDRAAREYRE